MKHLIYLFLLIFTVQGVSQKSLSSVQWEEDLRFLQNTVHKDYPFLFKKTTAEEFDASVEALSENIPNMEDHQIIVGLAKIISSFKYGHTALGFRNNSDYFSQLPVNFYEFNDGLYIQGGHKDYTDIIGAKVLKIGDLSTEDALKAIYPVSPNENDQYFKAYGIRYLGIPEVLHAQGVVKSYKDGVELSLEKEGVEFKKLIKPLPKDVQLKTVYGFVPEEDPWIDARDQSMTPLYLKNLDKIYFYEYLPDLKTVYVRQSQVQDDPSEDIPTFYNKVFNFIEENEVERLIIDVRLNGGGNNYKNKAVITGIIETEKINQPGKLFVIIGRRTFSACQNLVNEIDNYTNAIFVGEPTGENINFYGDNNRIELPNSKLPVFLSYAWWQDKPQWEGGQWLAPHIAVDMSFTDYVSNRDPVIQMALKFKNENFVLDPMAYLTKLFEKGDIETLKSEAVRLVNDPQYQFFDFEGELNSAGYNLMNAGRNQEALFVFEMNTQLFPESANTWDSLAAGFLNSGDKDKAIDLYNKVVKMDPSGRAGQNAKRMLHQINEGKD